MEFAWCCFHIIRGNNRLSWTSAVFDSTMVLSLSMACILDTTPLLRDSAAPSYHTDNDGTTASCTWCSLLCSHFIFQPSKAMLYRNLTWRICKSTSYNSVILLVMGAKASRPALWRLHYLIITSHLSWSINFFVPIFRWLLNIVNTSRYIHVPA